VSTIGALESGQYGTGRWGRFWHREICRKLIASRGSMACARVSGTV